MQTGQKAVDVFVQDMVTLGMPEAAGTVFVTVTPVNDAPVAVADSSYELMEDTSLTVFPLGVLSNDTDIDGDTLTAVLASGPANGTVTVEPNGGFTYTPNLNFFGTDSFTYRAVDPDPASGARPRSRSPSGRWMT